MNVQEELRHGLHLLAEDPSAPLVRPDLERARADGRRLIRRRRTAKVVAPALALATVAGLAVTAWPQDDAPRTPPVVAAPRFQLLVNKAAFGWLPSGHTSFFTHNEDGVFSLAAQSGGRHGSQVVLSVFRKGKEPALGMLPGAVPAKRVPVRPINGRRAHWLQAPSYRATEARLRFQLHPGQWAEVEINAWKRGNMAATVRRIAESVKPLNEPAALPVQIKALPQGFGPGSVRIATQGSSIGWDTTINFSPGLFITLSLPNDTSGDVGRPPRKPNSTFNGHPAYQGPPTGIPLTRETEKKTELMCLYELKGLNMCVYTLTAKAAALLKPSGGLKGLAARIKVLGADPADWTTTPLR
ncbi:hypothetical protein [Actinomadura sp. 9N407]|uniref:hypothetical protein n=1 Tax=Actinomadura sp. 9N407 TaxID=3375154 RepID=UPI0037AF87DD